MLELTASLDKKVGVAEFANPKATPVGAQRVGQICQRTSEEGAT